VDSGTALAFVGAGALAGKEWSSVFINQNKSYARIEVKKIAKDARNRVVSCAVIPVRGGVGIWPD
jgi:hypothetical protein